MNDKSNKQIYDSSVIKKSRSSIKSPLRKFEELKMLRNPLSKIDSKLQKHYNLNNINLTNRNNTNFSSKDENKNMFENPNRNGLKLLDKPQFKNNILNVNMNSEHYNIFKELHKIKGIDIGKVNIPEIANLDLPGLLVDITKAKHERETVKLQLFKIKKFYENFNTEEKTRESEIRGEIKWFNKTLHNRDINQIRMTTENLYSDIIDNINLINVRVQDDIENRKVQLHLKTENLFDFTSLQNNNFLKNTLKSQEGMIKILYNFTQEMGRIRSNYENIRRRIKTYNELNFKFTTRIEEETLKIEKIKSDMMKYKIKLNKLKTNTKTNDLKKILNKEKRQRRMKVKSDLNNINNKLYLSNNNEDNEHNLQRSKEGSNHSNEDCKNYAPDIKILNNQFNKNSSSELFHNKEKVGINANSPLMASNCEEIKNYQNEAERFIYYVLSSTNKNNLNKEFNFEFQSEAYVSTPFTSNINYMQTNNYNKSKKYFAQTEKNFFKDNNINTKKGISQEEKKVNYNANTITNVIARKAKKEELNIEENYKIGFNKNVDENNNDKFNNKPELRKSIKDDFFLSQKNSIIDIIDKNPKIGNTVLHLTNNLNAYRVKLNMLLKDQTNYLITKNKLQEILYSIVKRFKRNLKEENYFLYQNKIEHFSVNHINMNYDKKEINLAEVENIASERRRFIDLLVKDKDILLAFYDDKFPKINSMNQTFN